MTNNIAVLASTNATDMQAIIDAIESKKLDAVIKVLICNNDCNAFKRARKHNIPAIFLNPKNKTRDEYDKEISKIIEDNDVSLILLIGYMKIMSNWFVNKYRNKVMNIHPSLLPAFAGGMDIDVHEAVLQRGCKYTGATLIFIDEGADTGPIIMQKCIDIKEDDTADSLKQKVQEIEQELLLKVIPLYFNKKLEIDGKKVTIRRSKND